MHLATGCATAMGGVSNTYRTRPEPDCPNGFATCVSLLMAAGADPNVVSKQGNYTPLMGACLSGDAECCRLLLQAGAAVNYDKASLTIHHCATTTAYNIHPHIYTHTDSLTRSLILTHNHVQAHSFTLIRTQLRETAFTVSCWQQPTIQQAPEVEAWPMVNSESQKY